jgi:hypothetical protein
MIDFVGGRRLVLAGLTVLVGVLAAAPAQALQQLGNTEEESKFTVNATAFGKLLDGTVAYDPKTHKDVTNLAAKHFVYPLTWKTFQADKTVQGGLTFLRKRFGETMTVAATLSGKNKDFMKPLAHELIGCFKQVLDLPFEANHHAVTSAALMLQDFGKCRQEEVHEFLMELTKADKDNKFAYSPFIRMCAIRGLGEFSNPDWAAVDDKGNALVPQVNAKLKRDVERVRRLAEFVNYPYAPQGTTQEHTDAYVFVRREGIKALAQSQVPAYSAELKKEVQGPAAYYLLYIAAGGKFAETPDLTLSEKVEAVLGLCNMTLKETPTYNPEFSVWVAALCLAELTVEYNRDVVYFAKVPGSKDAKALANRLEELPWQAYAARFEDALTTLANNIPRDSAVALKNLTILKNKLGPTTLATIKEHKKMVEPEVPSALSAYAASIRPMNPEIYPGTKDSLKLAGPK